MEGGAGAGAEGDDEARGEQWAVEEQGVGAREVMALLQHLLQCVGGQLGRGQRAAAGGSPAAQAPGSGFGEGGRGVGVGYSVYEGVGVGYSAREGVDVGYSECEMLGALARVALKAARVSAAWIEVRGGVGRGEQGGAGRRGARGGGVHKGWMWGSGGCWLG